MKTIVYKSITFKIGKDRIDNDMLLQLSIKENLDYLWFHLNSFSSGFVIMCETIDNLKRVHNFSDSDTDDILRYGAKLCLENTKYRNLENIYVIYSPLHKIKKTETPGCVIVLGKKNLIRL